MSTLTGPQPAFTGRAFTPGGEDPYAAPPVYGMPPRHPEALFERLAAERAPTRQQPVLAPGAGQEIRGQQAGAGLLAARQEAIAAGERDRARMQPVDPEVLGRALRGLRRSAAEDAVIGEVPDTPAALVAQAAPADDGGWLRDLLAEALRSLAGTRAALALVCEDCKTGDPCARHALRVREAARAWLLAEQVARSLTTRDALLALSVEAGGQPEGGAARG